MFNIIDNLFVENSLRDGTEEGRLVKVRGALLRVYNSNYRPEDDDDHGSSNDTVGLDPEFQQFSARDAPVPSIADTEQTDEGFLGLEAPLG